MFKEKIEECVDLLDIVKDPYELSYDMFEVFIFNLKTNDNKRISIELLCQKVNDLKLKLKNINDSHMQFDLKELLNDYVECITDIELGIKYFHKNYIQSDKEIKEYVLLNKLYKANLKDEFCKEYEKNVNKIKFRDSLKERYNKLKL